VYVVWRVQSVGNFWCVVGIKRSQLEKFVVFLLSLVAVAIAANKSGRFTMIAGIKLVILFTHSLLL
jgi:hypothetical protein